MKNIFTITIFLTVFSMNAQWIFNANGSGVETATNNASGDRSVSMGRQTAASGLVSTSMGDATNASGDISTAIGFGTNAIGDYSTAMGLSTTASGEYSTAMGYFTTASGLSSTAMGYFTTASGDYSTSIGYNNTASGLASTSMGSGGTASGDYSMKMGFGSFATGDISTAMGRHVVVNDYASFSIGSFNTIQTTNATAFDLANRAFVIGNGTDFGNRSDALTVLFDGTTTIAGEVTATAFIGDGSQLTNLPNNSGWSLNANGTGVQTEFANASGSRSSAMGNTTFAGGDYSTAMGSDTNASGDFSTAMGSTTFAGGLASTAMGNTTNASGLASTAMGSWTFAGGNFSTAMGSDTNASGEYSTAMGFFTTASGRYATVMGIQTTANDYGSFSIGSYNTLQTTNAAAFDLANRALVIGNGTSAGNRSDALTVLFDGTTTIAGDVTATAFIGDGSQLTNAGTDDQQLSLNVNSLELEDGGSVDLSTYLDNTDDQAITYDAVTNVVSLEDGGTIDLSALNNSGTDDQQLSLNVNSLELEDGGTIDLSSYLDNTDDQAISYDTVTNVVTLEDGGTIDLSALNNSGTDDQILANFILSNGSALSLAIQDGNVVSVDLAPLLEDLEAENAAQQAQIEAILAVNAAQQAQIDDLIARMEAREECACDDPLGVGDFNAPADGAKLLQNVPNPFDNSTNIRYFIPLIYSKANIVISSSLGQILQNIPITTFGEGSINVEKNRMSSAIYFYTLYVDGKQIDSKRMIVE